jgi:hypothetical protein
MCAADGLGHRPPLLHDGPVTPSRASSAAPATVASSRPRILLPFIDRSLPQRALDTALRIARTENATLVPVRLERIPLDLPLDAALGHGHQVTEALTRIRRHARDLGVRVDPRIGHGRSYRHALLHTLAKERYHRVILAAGPGSGVEFTPADVAWLVGHAHGEIVVVAAETPFPTD